MIRTVEPIERVTRIAYSDDVAAFPDWIWQSGQNRWDDPRVQDLTDEERRHLSSSDDSSPDYYRVLYTATSRLGAYQETLQGFRYGRGPRTDPARRKIAQIIEDSDEIPKREWTGAPKSPAWGAVPTSHLATLFIGEIHVGRNGSSPLADVERLESIQFLRSVVLAMPLAEDLGLIDVSRGDIVGGNRRLTQSISRIIFDGSLQLGGIYHLSALGAPEANWAFFEGRSTLETVSSHPVDLSDPALAEALRNLQIQLVKADGEPIDLRAD